MLLQKRRKRYYKHEALARYAKLLGFGEVHERIDDKSGLHTIIAIHSTQLGPAIGGTRFFAYSSIGAAFKDVLRLSYMMTLKSAISNLPHGGAKAVIIKPNPIKDRELLFKAYGDFVHELNGRYITAIDVGTSNEDMGVIATRTPYVAGISTLDLKNDPSLYTARGVLQSMLAAVQFKMKRNSLAGLRVAIQGAGNVGRYLCDLLNQQGADIIITDLNTASAQHCSKAFHATVVGLDEIYEVPCDIFSPCALGGTINAETIPRLNCAMVIGSANNQLSHEKVIHLLEKKDILYVPDYLANSGGLINAAMVYDYQDIARAEEQIIQLFDSTLHLLERSHTENKSTTFIAHQIVKERLGYFKE